MRSKNFLSSRALFITDGVGMMPVSDTLDSNTAGDRWRPVIAAAAAAANPRLGCALPRREMTADPSLHFGV